jgi:acylphosphatase
VKQFRALVRGRVQGVCFRAETVGIARELGLIGFARNLDDGSVEVVAAGEEPALAKLVDFLRCGPRLARVDDLAVHWDDCTPPGEGFRVRY